MTAPTKAQLEFLQSIDTPTVCNLVEIVSPERRGFGYTVMHDVVSQTVQGDVKLDYAPEGFLWHLSMPDRFLAPKAHREARV